MKIMLMEGMRTMPNWSKNNEIEETLEEIRSSKYSQISRNVIKTILEVQYSNQDEDQRERGRNETKEIIRKYIDSQIGD